MTKWIAISALALLGACATSSLPYGPALGDDAKGYTVSTIESNRYRVTYRDTTMELARSRALRRAAEITLEQGSDWFQVVTAYSDNGELAGGGPSVSVGGSTASVGSTRVGLGVGLPIGGLRTGSVEHVLEVVTGRGPKPDNPDAYNAEDVLANLADS